MSHRKFAVRLLIVAVAMACFIAVTAFAQQDGAAAAAIHVATYNPQLVFTSHPDTMKIMAEMQQYQQQLQDAQQKGDREAFSQAQQKMQQRQSEAIEAFQKELQATASAVAKEKGLSIVAVQIDYAADNIKVDDVTDAIIGKIKEAHGVNTTQPAAPTSAPAPDASKDTGGMGD